MKGVHFITVFVDRAGRQWCGEAHQTRQGAEFAALAIKVRGRSRPIARLRVKPK